MRRYTVVGAGAVGLLYGGRLQAAGHPVAWVVRSGADTLASEGIRLTSPYGDARLTDVEVHTDPPAAPPADVVIVALKTTANDRLAELVAPAVADGATVAMFQNGLGLEQQLAAAAPQAGPILGGLCFVCARRTAPGVVDHMDYGRVDVAPLDPTDSGTAAEVVEDLRRAGVEADEAADLVTARWRKLAWNIPFNGLSVVLGAGTDEMVASAPINALARRVMAEVVAGGRACGAELTDDLIDQMINNTATMTPYDTSMRVDHENQRPMEIDAIYEVPITTAASAGVAMPAAAVIRDQLRHLDASSGPA